MSYIVLARRYRPLSFDQIIGQEHISRTLKNAISENRVAHAYLFSGPRGVGKTTTARILAKALNCKKGPTPEPCGECPNCLEITSGSSVDVQEIDGASNRGIDEIRALRENVKFAPASSKYKIYIIDEAHQITDAAFNALLKTLEEPPDHVVFIMATTEPQKIPITILSRCQRYRYRLLSSKEIMAHLSSIVKSEKLSVEDDALRVITTASGGSLRDALSLLDQAISFVTGTVTVADVQNLLGSLPQDIIYSMSEALAKRDGAKVLSIIKEVAEQGHSLLQFARDLREHFRCLLLGKLNPEILDVTLEEKNAIDKQAPLFTQDWLIRAGHMLSKALDEMRWSEQPRLLLELYVLKISLPYAGIDELVERLEKLEAGGDFENDPMPIPNRVIVEKREAAGVPAETAAEAAEPETAARRVSQDENISSLWKAVVHEAQSEKPMMAGIVGNSEPADITGNVLLIRIGNQFQEEGIKRNQQFIEGLVEKRFGRRLSLRTTMEKSKGDPIPEATNEVIVVPEEENTPVQPAVYQVEGDASDMKDVLPQGIDKILGKFPGKIRKKKV